MESQNKGNGNDNVVENAKIGLMGQIVHTHFTFNFGPAKQDNKRKCLVEDENKVILEYGFLCEFGPKSLQEVSPSFRPT